MYELQNPVSSSIQKEKHAEKILILSIYYETILINLTLV